MAKALKNRASKQPYVSPTQIVLSGFESPFSRQLNPENRWVVLAHKIPWDTLVSVYQNQPNRSSMYMQYFIGYSSFSNEEPFDPSLFVDFRKRLGKDQINLINEKILGLTEEESPQGEPPVKETKEVTETPAVTMVANQGSCVVDATACPQDITNFGDTKSSNKFSFIAILVSASSFIF